MENTVLKAAIYTVGTWTVKPGREKEFIAEWTSLAKWTGKNIPGPGKGYLLQDEKNSLHFISYGTWENRDTILKWRESNEFKTFMTRVKDFLDHFEPHTLKLVATSD